MAKDLLFEIGMEEVPARFVRKAMEQLQAKVTDWLQTMRIDFGEVQAYATPRRISVIISSMADKQTDIREEFKGPSKKMAMDEQGNWTKAALGFARGQEINTDSLYFRELSGVEYVYAAKNSEGAETSALLSDGLNAVIHSMSFPKNMRWGNYDLRFIRPIRWLIALYGTEVIPLDIAGVLSGRISKGHRFLGNDVEISEPAAYVECLRQQSVLVNVQERQQLIVKQIEQLAQTQKWNVPIREDLLEEIVFLVEYPTALFGTFEPEFLHIPQEVLITSMREHQRYFPVLDDSGNLLPHFITVRNGNTVALEQVAKGNEKVLRARLADAQFFYHDDQKLSIDSALERLETIVFHDELGTVGDKVRRIGHIADRLAEALRIDDTVRKEVVRAAALCKFDLVTQMVHEFPELQGVMGEDYARKAGESEQVARAILEHYQPRYAEDGLPASIVGAIVSVADKIDTIIGCFSLGIIPTGSQDPYALRRQATGIVRILFEHKLPCALSQLFNIAIQAHDQAGLLKRKSGEILEDVAVFFALRIKNILTETLRYDVVEAVMASGFDDVFAVVSRGEALMSSILNTDIKTTVESFNRVNNLAAKAGDTELDVSLFVEPVEHNLYEAWQHVHVKFNQQLNTSQEGIALQTLGELKEPITQYFDAVMVMDDDEQLRNVRLALLNHISQDLRKFADFRKLVWS